MSTAEEVITTARYSLVLNGEVLTLTKEQAEAMQASAATNAKLRAFAIAMAREKLLHGSNPTLLVEAQKLDLPEVAELLRDADVDAISPLTEAKAKVRKLTADLETAAAVTEQLEAERDAADGLAHAAEEALRQSQTEHAATLARVPTDDQVVLLKADYERLIRSLPTVLVSVPK